MNRRRLLAPEVVQTSHMDCGPASLKCLLEGFGIGASYGRLREACQTGVDGSSIDTMEDVARQLGLDAEQIMIPIDHVLSLGTRILPAIAIVRLPNGITHFVIAWRRHGRFIQLMDPATGRRWIAGNRFLQELYVHSMPVAAAAWRDWAGSELFVGNLRERLVQLRISGSTLLETALDDPGWRKLAALDAALRMLDTLAKSRGVRRGKQAARMLDRFCSREEIIPAEYWSVRPCSGTPDEEERVTFRGAVLVHVRGRLPETEREAPVSPELAVVLKERPSRPGRELLRLLRNDGVLVPAVLLLMLALAAGGIMLEAVLFRGFFDLARELGLAGQRMSAIAALTVLLIALLLLELPLATTLLRFGRGLEVRLRVAFLEKIPHLCDRYFQSRPASDMAERSHSIHRIRHLPDLAGQFARGVMELVLTAAGIAWLDPASSLIAALAAVIALGLPLLAQPVIVERDLRVRMHSGALSRFYLDALLGLTPIRAHGAGQAIRGEHGKLLVEWARAGFGLQRVAVWVETLQMLAGFGLAAWLLLAHLGRSGEGGGVLLLIYWALNLPLLGQEVALAAWQYPANRNLTLRMLEPLGAIEERPSTTALPGLRGGQGTSIQMHAVTVRAAGHAILENIDLEIAPGSHVAIVGPSGAGKSSLVGLLLGWHRPTQGGILADGAPLSENLRRDIAWVDPAVHLWNRSFFENLRYGTADESPVPMSRVVQCAHLHDVLERLPDGFQTTLGEGGGLVSGGEGQRVRLARAMLRPGVRLAILDEPFRGLDRERRRELLACARGLWKQATLLCITHDVGETKEFDRVLVIEGGRIVEDGAPRELALQGDSRYSAMLDAEEAVREGLWSNGHWRRLRLEQGKLLC